jgi:nitrogen fixation protein FixH
MSPEERQAAFTGRHMLLTMLAFFGVIIAANFTMAWFARSSWTGFVVENSYVASQQFNTKMAETRAQQALGWTGHFSLADGTVRYEVSDAKGADVALEAVTVTFRRPVDDREDHTIVLAKDAGGYAAAHDVADGMWLVEIGADAHLAHPYRETHRIHVVQGVLQ